MTKNHAVLAGPFFIALIGTIFCVWSALGNDVNFCVTTGCTLYQDFSIGGISLWWLGTAAFTVLVASAFLGQASMGKRLSALFLLGDVCLLALMAMTAPCISCLIAACLFALCYFFFRRIDFAAIPPKQAGSQRRSWLLFIWTLLFVINVGQVVRSQADVWPILDESGDARIRMFFSPSCKYCVEGINALSGNIEVAFYPVAENEKDVFRLAKMIGFLDEGMSLAEALGQSEEVDAESFPSSFRPDILLLRFRLLRNKAHVFAAGSQGVPFFEIRGLPADIMAKIQSRNQKSVTTSENSHKPADSGDGENSSSNGPKDASLPAEIDVSGQCLGAQPCP